ncbi:MAG: amidase [Betaproteobacteria bacterium]|nr:amidase [Betaproteobacteria bacterium]
MAARKSGTPLHELSAAEIIEAVATGDTTCEAVARACLDRIAAREPHVQAWHYLNPEQVIAQARALDKSGKRGPLLGVPFGVKDIIDTCDMPTEYGSPIYVGHRPASDAACVALSRKAGGVLMGKTVTTEFANRHPGKTRNPLDPARTPGGSSSGSAASVADYMVPVALGTQITGSTIKPASFCGVFGYRPTYGDLRCAGVKEASGSLDTLGLYARSIEDISLYRDVLLGIEPEPIPSDVPVPKVGFCRTTLWHTVEPTTQKLLEDAAQRLARAGSRVEDVNLPPEFGGIPEAHRWISSFEFSRNFTWEIENYWGKISETLRNGRLKHGLSCTFDQYRRAREFAAHCRRQLRTAFDQHDVLLTAPVVGEAPIGLDDTGNSALCAIWTTVHVPVLTVPAFTGSNGLPIGAQLIGRGGDDRKLFANAHWIYRQLR